MDASDVKQKGPDVKKKKLFYKPIVLLKQKEIRKKIVSISNLSSLPSAFIINTAKKLNNSNLNVYSSLLCRGSFQHISAFKHINHSGA